MEARKFSGLAINTLVELMKGTHTDSTRFNAATALLDRGFGLASSERGFAPDRRGNYETGYALVRLIDVLNAILECFAFRWQ